MTDGATGSAADRQRRRRWRIGAGVERRAGPAAQPAGRGVGARRRCCCRVTRSATVSEQGLRPDDFYRPAHQHIFDAIRALYSTGAPADTITVADELRRAGLLEQVGGTEALHELQNATPAISNAGHYARIVQDTALLRRLIHVAGDIAELAYSEPDDVTRPSTRPSARSSRSPRTASPTPRSCSASRSRR